MLRFNRKTRREVPGLNTSSLPDLIFTVLFFFIIVTHIRQNELQVAHQLPQGTQTERLAGRKSVVYLHIGRGSAGHTQIQLNNNIVALDELAYHIDAERKRMAPDDARRMTVSILADRDTPMGVISDVKRELSKANALRINYSALPQKEEKPPFSRPEIAGN